MKSKINISERLLNTYKFVGGFNGKVLTKIVIFERYSVGISSLQISV